MRYIFTFTVLFWTALLPHSRPLQAAEATPVLLGYGVKECASFLQNWNAREQQDPLALSELERYRQWLAGLVTGLNLATGMDVIRGMEVEDAMNRAAEHCQRNPQDDFFTATMDLVRTLSKLRN